MDRRANAAHQRDGDGRSRSPAAPHGAASIFELAECGRRVRKRHAQRRLKQLRRDLLETQARLRDAPFPTLLVFGGVDGAGKGETAQLLNEWMDPRDIANHAYGEPTQEEQERPSHWRFWRDLPAHGRIAIILGGWHHRPLLDHVYGKTPVETFDVELERINLFERMLTDDGALILKFWMHLGRDEQEQRFRRLESDPMQSWRVTELDWQHFGMYDRFVEVSEHLLRQTSTDAARWTIVEGEDANYRSLAVGTIVRDAINARLDGRPFQVELDAARHVMEPGAGHD